MKDVLIALLFLTVALGSPALADDAADIQAQGAAFERAVNAGDVAGITAVYTEDAMLLPPDAPVVQGKEAIEGFWQQLAASGAVELKVTPVETEVFGDHAYRVISFTLRAGPADAEPMKGKAMEIWRKEPDGIWRAHRDVWNMDAAMPMAQ